MLNTESHTEISRICGLFFDEAPVSYSIIDTGMGEDDFRHTIIAQTAMGEKHVVKLADNDFTSPEKIAVWQRAAEEYGKLGYYCPRILGEKNTGAFPVTAYAGHNCVAYAEEFAPFQAALGRDDDANFDQALYDSYKRDIWTMSARVAAKHFDFAPFPSAWCLFETFCPSDETDEVLENALAWKRYADSLPEEFQEQVRRIWQLWQTNRSALEKIYPLLPTSVFQADLNPTNILLDDAGKFVGVFDFNLCGRDVFINYMMREIFDDFEQELARIREALKIAGETYTFSEREKEAAPMLFRCLKPLWINKLGALKGLGSDPLGVKAFLDKTEYYLTADLDFESYMGRK